MAKKYPLKRLLNIIMLGFQKHIPVNGQMRYKLLKYCGVSVHGKHGFIGSNVLFDSIRPDLIEIEEGAYITDGVRIYTHYLNAENFYPSKGGWWTYDKVIIGKNSFIGSGTIICKSITIGEGAIVGAGSVVTKDIPAYQVWAGNPAKFVKERISD